MPYAVPGDPVARLREVLQRQAVVTAGRRPTGLTHEDADDEVGTAATDDAVGFDPLPLLSAFGRAGVQVVVIGQVAGILHGSSEPTGDLDLLWDGDPARAAAMAAVLAGLGARLTDDDGAPVACTADALLLPKVLFRTATAAGDCCTPALPWGEQDVVAMLDRACSAPVGDGTTVHYLCLPDLVAMRRAVGRPKDLRRAAELEGLAGTAEGVAAG